MTYPAGTLVATYCTVIKNLEFPVGYVRIPFRKSAGFAYHASIFPGNFTFPIKMVELEIPYLEALCFHGNLPSLLKW
jgi:hypothetical protein